MKTFKLNGATYPLEFTFNSIILIEDLDIIGLADDLKNRPLKVISVTATLLWAVLNKDKYILEKEEVVTMLDEWCNKDGNNIVDLFNSLQEALENSGFFQKLMKSQNMEMTSKSEG